jgi:hypothetical protein
MPTFNPYSPASYFDLWSRALNPWMPPPAVYPVQPRVPAGTPIAIKASNSDPGIQLDTDRAHNRVTISGTTQGPFVKRDLSGFVDYEVARGMGFTLDIDTAPTEDIFGRTDYRAKNKRLFGLDTTKGWSAAECADRLARKVNDAGEFRATVTRHRDGSASIDFARR